MRIDTWRGKPIFAIIALPQCFRIACRSVRNNKKTAPFGGGPRVYVELATRKAKERKKRVKLEFLKHKNLKKIVGFRCADCYPDCAQKKKQQHNARLKLRGFSQSWTFEGATSESSTSCSFFYYIPTNESAEQSIRKEPKGNLKSFFRTKQHRGRLIKL